MNIVSIQKPTIWNELGRIIGPVLSAGSEFGLWDDLMDVLKPEFVELIRAFDLEDETRALPLEALTAGFPSLKSILSSRAEEILESLNEREKEVLDRRLLTNQPWTLEDVGKSLGITRERVRQIQKSVQGRISTDFGTELTVFARIIKKQLGPVVLKNDFHRVLHGIDKIDCETGEITLEKYVGGASAESSALIAHALQDRLGYLADAGVYFNPEAMQVVAVLKLEARILADEVNLVDEEELKKSLPDSSWLKYWDLLLDGCGFFKHFGILALRDSNRVRAKAALVSIGRPATKKEISSICGLPANRVSSYLSSFKSVVRAGPDTWSLAEWGNDAYNGGGQQAGIRSGTVPLALAVGLGTAAAIMNSDEGLGERVRNGRTGGTQETSTCVSLDLMPKTS